MNLESPNRVHRHRTWLVHHHKILIHVEDPNRISQHLQVTTLLLTYDIYKQMLITVGSDLQVHIA